VRQKQSRILIRSKLGTPFMFSLLPSLVSAATASSVSSPAAALCSIAARLGTFTRPMPFLMAIEARVGANTASAFAFSTSATTARTYASSASTTTAASTAAAMLVLETRTASLFCALLLPLQTHTPLLLGVQQLAVDGHRLCHSLCFTFIHRLEPSCHLLKCEPGFFYQPPGFYR
jgi:hypothetical protein